NGAWSGTGVSGTLFDPIAGSQTLTYTTNLGDCDVSAELSIEVTNPSDASTISPANGQLCSNSGEGFVQTLDLTILVTGETGGIWTYNPEVAGFNPISSSTFNANGLPIDTYTLTYIVDGGEPCGEVSSSQNIEVVECLPDCTADASFNLPPDLCGIAGNILDLNTLVTGDVGGTWTTSAPTGTLTGSSFNPEDLLGDFTITYTVSDNIADCPDAIQNASINIIAPPTAMTTAPTQNFCDTEVGFNLSNLVAGETGGTWSSPDAPTAIDNTGFFSFEGIAAGQYVVVYTIAAEAPCTENASSSEIITIQANDNTAGEDAEVCSLTTSLNAISSEEGFWAISLAPSPTATADFADESDPQTAVTVNESGVYTFFWSHIDPFANVCFDEDEVEITFSEPMQVSTESVCSADNLTYDLTATISGGYPPYNVNGTEIVGNIYSLTLNDEEAYSFVIDDSGNCDEIEVNGSFSCFCPPPADPVIVANNLSYCEGETIPTFSVINNGVDTFLWYETETANAPIASGIDFTPSMAGTYWVEALSPDGCISVNRLPVTLQEIPTPNPPQVTPLSAIVLQNQFFIAEAIPSEGGEINWYNELGELVFTGLEHELPTEIAGDFMLFVTETVNGCESEPTEFNYTVNPFDLEDCPNITSFNVPNPHHVCSGEEITISFVNDDEANYVRGEWVDFDENVLSNDKSLTISETVTGCNAQAFQYIARTYCLISPDEVFDADTLTVIFYPFPESATIEEVGTDGCSVQILPQSACPNFSIYTEAGDLVEGSFDFPFGAGTVNFVLANEDALAVGLENCAEPISYNYNCIQVGCPTIDPPIALSQTEVSFCENEEITFNFEVEAPLEGLVNWYDVEAGGEPILESSLSFTAISEGIYYAETMTLPDDCRSTRVPFSLMVNPLDDSSFSYPNTVFCLNEDNPLPDFVATAAGTFSSPNGINIDASTGEILLSELIEGTEYTIEYQTSGDCPTTSSFTFNIAADELEIDAGEAINICQNDPISLNGEILLGTPNTLQWSANIEGNFDNPSELQTVFQPTDTTSNFYLYLTATNSCEEFVVDSVQVRIEEIGELSIEGNTTLNLGETTQLEVTGGNGIFQWTADSDLSCTDCFNPIFTATTAGTTTLVVESEAGCIPPLTINITVIAPEIVPTLTFPNAFSPNGDGINDEFIAVSNERLESYSLQVYNRWGEQVFESMDMNEVWDGSYKDRMCEIGVYVYVLQYQFVGGEVELKQGNVTLVF
ncbi:MAG: gliding motility-associated C-terminal domain-containing protein, partial [Chitinophagales bacterium]